MCTRLHDVTSQTAATFIVTAVKIRGLTKTTTGVLDETETAKLNQEKAELLLPHSVNCILTCRATGSDSEYQIQKTQQVTMCHGTEDENCSSSHRKTIKCE
jgi:hypothetical protein